MKRIAWMVVGWLALLCAAHAASFDCAKAGTKVEKLICGDAEISKLDDDLNAAYKTALQDEKQADTVKQAQKRWMKERNGCADKECVKRAYEAQLSTLAATHTSSGVSATTKDVSLVSAESYRLVMSKDDGMCNHMRQLMNDDLMQFERVYDSHDRYVSGLDEFKRIPWKPARASAEHYGQVDYTEIEGALFDLNNDGVQDFVVRYEASLSGMDADGLYMFDRSVASRADVLTFKELFESNNQIAMAGWFYDLSAPLAGRTKSLWRLSPFIYHGVSYVYMQSLYKKDEAIGGDFVVIAKFISGKFHGNTIGKMEDICYIERTNVKTK